MWDFQNYGNTLAETVCNLFNYATTDYNATVEGCQKIIDALQPKCDRFDALFKDFPGFNAEQHCLVLDTKLFRSIDTNIITRFFSDYVIDNALNNVRKPYLVDGKDRDDWYYVFDHCRDLDRYIKELPTSCLNYHGVRENTEKMRRAYDLYKTMPKYTPDSEEEFKKRKELIYKLRQYYVQLVDNELADFVNERYPDIRSSAGQRVSKLVRKICERKWELAGRSDFESEYAKYSDAINPIELNEVLILSWNILDYLTMSFLVSTTSCHTIDKYNKHEYKDHAATYDGCWSAGVLSYAGDMVSIVGYTVKREQSNVPFWNRPKVSRQMFHIGENGMTIVQGRLYPKDQSDNGFDADPEAYKQYREVVQSLVAKAYNIPNLWNVKRGISACGDVTSTTGVHYPDYIKYQNPNVSTNQSSEERFVVAIGSMPICPGCGKTHNRRDWCSCYDCQTTDDSPYYTCANCGGEFDDRDDLYEIDGQLYCNCCSTYCEYHDRREAIHIDDMNYVIGYYGDGYMCDEGLRELINSERVYECEECGRYFSSDYYYATDITDDNGEVHHYCSSSCARNH